MTCEFKIKDNGIGLSEEFIKNELFTPFVHELLIVKSIDIVGSSMAMGGSGSGFS